MEIKVLQPHGQNISNWKALGHGNGVEPVEISGRKIVLTCGAHVNHVLEPSFAFKFDLNIWEMAASCFSVNPGPSGTVFPGKRCIEDSVIRFENN